MEHRVQELNETKTKLELEVSALFKSKDKVLEEIKQQRAWKTEVQQDKFKLEEKLNSITNLLTSFEQELNNVKNLFNNTKESNVKVIDKFEKEITVLSNKLNSIKELDKDIDILEDQKVNIKASIDDYKSKLSSFDSEIKQRGESMKKREEELEKKEIALQLQIQKNDELNRQLVKKEKDLLIKEKRQRKLLSKK